MPIKYVARYTRAEIQANPQNYYVFGDNLSQRGRGGQAKECRDEPNTVGIPTKRVPSMDESAFLSDVDYDTVKPIIQHRFRVLAEHLSGGGDVVWPKDGVGTGLAQLPQRAPKIAAFIDRCLAELERRSTRS